MTLVSLDSMICVGPTSLPETGKRESVAADRCNLSPKGYVASASGREYELTAGTRTAVASRLAGFAVNFIFLL